jgi:hypothetical protein
MEKTMVIIQGCSVGMCYVAIQLLVFSHFASLL